MNQFYILGIDQSTQGTKGVIVNENGLIVESGYISHQQIVNEKGWISHNPEEIYQNVLEICRQIITDSGIDTSKLLCLSLTNQRETTIAWSKRSGQSLCDAIVWQCSRAAEICKKYEAYENEVYSKTGLTLSPYYPASKIVWMLENVDIIKRAKEKNDLAFGTMDSYLMYNLTNGKSYKTDYSNASRTQLFNLKTLKWDTDICNVFGIQQASLPEVCDSDSIFGFTDLNGILDKEIPICGVLGDSHAALFGHGCHKAGSIKATYGTGSSVMLNTGTRYITSKHGLSTSLAWKINGKPTYVLEGNINYTGAVISWIKDNLNLIESTDEIDSVVKKANKDDTTYIVPAFTGLGAPHWKSNAKALICGMSSQTTKNEIVKATCESIAYQVNDIIESMRQETNIEIKSLYVDGGVSKNQYIMQFQSDISEVDLHIPNIQELSLLGVIYLAGISYNVWDYDKVKSFITYDDLTYLLDKDLREEKLNGWKEAISMTLKGC
ncbi:FGGY-family carbohydrate kinase [Breznakia pachnodae]|uniref:ATP:glycerol 3-phosphotransferase n=1 Tax=Breznakia pachnodae TaxID=265178 RepID=A0ABU0E3J9_9FIRM|nr:glycerol kinase GlpK [Breznakia pachnodae]MDQ0361468.1 glycerol kinase [Breznakia pachnodae]